MKVLIIGASGFIGNSCLDYFSKDYETIGVDRINPFFKNIVIDNNFSEIGPLIEKSAFDVIINCAGSSNISESFTNTENDFSLNTIFVQKILDLLKNTSQKTKFINLSSAAVYGNAVQLPINEDAVPNPLSPYGFHKLLSEQIIQEYHKLFAVNALSVRIFSAYGPGLKRQLIYDLYCKFKANNKRVTLYGTGNESRDFIFITDIINALDVLINNAQFAGEVYNLSSGEESYINKTAKLFAEICNYKGEISFMNSQIEGYPINWRADITKLKSLGFSQKTSLEEGLSKYLKWLQENQL